MPKHEPQILKYQWHKAWGDWVRGGVYAIAIAFCAHILFGAGLAHRLPAEPPVKPQSFVKAQRDRPQST
jgi:hypothetical protein